MLSQPQLLATRDLRNTSPPVFRRGRACLPVGRGGSLPSQKNQYLYLLPAPIQLVFLINTITPMKRITTNCLNACSTPTYTGGPAFPPGTIFKYNGVNCITGQLPLYIVP